MNEKVELDGDGVPLEAEGFSEKERAANRPGETGTEKADSGTKKADSGTEAETPKKRDWVEEAYKCFIKDAKDIDPTDPVKAVEAYFKKNATDELKARCKADGKDAKGCWKFIEAVARKALHGSDGHIDPAVVYAIAMHWFEDVPKDWDKTEHSSAVKTKKPVNKKPANKKPATAKPKKPAEIPSEVKKEKAKAKAAKKSKPRAQQGFFFDMLMQPDAQKPCGASSPQEAPVPSAEENAVEPSSEAGSISESEVQG